MINFNISCWELKMRLKTATLGLLILGYGLTAGQANANVTVPSKAVQFYAGLSGGVERMSGRQNQSISYPGAAALGGAALGVPEFISFLGNVSQSSKNGLYSAFGGFTWNIPSIPLFLGPEIYIGRSNAEIENRITIPEVGTLTNRSMQTSIQSSNFIGGSLQIGAHLPMQSRAYVLMGLDSSQFRYTTFYVPRSNLGGAGPDLAASSFATKKWKSGFIWGFGLEKEFKCFRVGGEIRFIQYRELKVSYNTDSADPLHSIETINNAYKPKIIRFSLRASYLF
jgi:hypothetical protein